MEYRINHAGRDILFSVENIRDKYLRECTLEAIRKFYGEFSTSRGGEVELTYLLTDHIQDFFDANDDVIMSESAKINSHQVFMTGHGNTFAYEFKDQKLVSIYYNITSPGHLENEKSKAKSRAFMSNVESQVTSMYSRGFLHGLQLKNLERGASFMHACSFSVNGNGYIVAATPGAGKSSLLLSLCMGNDISADFISDDFACVDSKQLAHHVGRSMAIKSHQIPYFPELAQKLKDMPFMQRLQWFILKRRGLKRMATPRQLFGDKIVSDVQVKRALYITNHNKYTYEHETMSPEDFANLNANMLFSELFLGMEIVNHSLFLPGNHLLPTADEFISNTRETLTKIFDTIPCELVKVPFRSDPREMLKFLCDTNLIK